jgi:N-acetylmuramoyl-L-alanine amidase
MKIQHILVDPGHGGSDPGAVNTRLNLKESDLTLAIAQEFDLQNDDRFSPAGHAIGVSLIRRSDMYVSLEERVRQANETGGHTGKAKVDLFLSFHINASENPKAQGFEVWTSIGDTAADPIATAIFNFLQEAMPNTPARVDYDDGDPDKETNFYVLRNTLMPAVLIEFEFISNDARAVFLALPANQALLACAVLNAVLPFAD